MLFKIALATIKHRWKDFLVLFTGLIIAISIFFMFSGIANNDAFLKANTTIKSISIIFIVGQILLGIITFIYLNFANRFLVQLRQREYGLLMMFGANKRAVANLLFLETVFIGVISLILGIVLGTGLTALAGPTLQNILDIHLTQWQVFNTKSLVITIIYFTVVFALNGIFNQIYIARTNVNKLLTASQTTEATPKRSLMHIISGVVGIIILVLSFVVLKHAFETSAVLGMLLLSLGLNITGTFLTIRSGLSLLLMLSQRAGASYHGLRRFTLGQLTFRLKAFERILTIVTLLFALALGALAVGRGFNISTPLLAEKSAANTISVKDPTAKERQLIKQLNGIKFEHTYTFKEHVGKNGDNSKFIFSADEFNTTPLPYQVGTRSNAAKVKIKTADASLLNKSTAGNANSYEYVTAYNELRGLTTNYFTNGFFWSIAIDNAQYASSKEPQSQIVVIRVNDMMANQHVLDQLSKSQQKRFKALVDNGSTGAYGFYQQAKGLFGGLEFMGFFLSIAFLVMLASTLMFKILTNVAVDQKRYRILTMLGATKAARLRANMLEIAILFAIPLIIGFADVYYGLPMFHDMLIDVYFGLPSAVLVIGSFYVIYYLITVLIYQRMLKNK